MQNDNFYQPGDFLAAVRVTLVLKTFEVVDGVFLAAVFAVIDLAPLVAGVVPVVFFSPTLVLMAGAAVGPVVFLVAVGVVVLLLTVAEGIFLATPLLWSFDTPFERRLWDMLGCEPDVILVGLVVVGFAFALALLVALALDSPEVLLFVLSAGVSLVCD